MPYLVHGHEDWGLRKDENGHREYFIKWLVEVDSHQDGPFIALNAPGLPMVGSAWAFGNDLDLYALCQPEWVVEPKLTKEAGHFWTVEQPFSTRPRRRCQDSQVDNPLNEPIRLGGSFTKLTKQATHDRFGKALINTAFEMIEGPEAEFDDNRPNVTVGVNVMFLPLFNIAQLVDTVNDSPMWGLPARTIKLSNVRWQRLVFGSCSYYYSVDYEFDISYNTFDKPITNYGTKVLKGWAPGAPIEGRLDPDEEVGGTANYLNPKNFEILKDEAGENMKIFLDSKGRPIEKLEDVLIKKLEYYPQANFFTLQGIPALL